MCSLKGADQTSWLHRIEVAGNVATRVHVRQGKTALDARIDHGGAARRLVEMSEKKMGHPHRGEGANGRPGVGALPRGRHHEMNLAGSGRTQESLEVTEALVILGTDARRVDERLAEEAARASPRRFGRQLL